MNEQQNKQQPAQGGGDERQQIEELARRHGTGGWQTLEDMVNFGLAVQALALPPAQPAPQAPALRQFLDAADKAGITHLPGDFAERLAAAPQAQGVACRGKMTGETVIVYQDHASYVEGNADGRISVFVPHGYELVKVGAATPPSPVAQPALPDASDRPPLPFAPSTLTVEQIRGAVQSACRPGQPTQPPQGDGRGTDAQIEKEREIARHAIVGALAAGYAGASHPGADHWLAAAHDAGLKIRELEDRAPQPAAARVGLGPVQITAGAKVLAACMDYPWDHMPEQGRQTMRKNVTEILAAVGIASPQEDGSTA